MFYYYHDREDGVTSGTIEHENGVNKNWRYMLMKDGKVIALFSDKDVVEKVITLLNKEVGK